MRLTAEQLAEIRGRDAQCGDEDGLPDVDVLAWDDLLTEDAARAVHDRRALLAHVAAMEGALAAIRLLNEQCAAEHNAMRLDLAACRRDAERYRWLRAHWDEPEVWKLHPWDDFSPDPDQLDAQIDAALKSTTHNQESVR